MIINISRKIENELTVLLSEECQYREWFWFPEMSEEKLIQWWKDLESFESYSTTLGALPGTLIELKEDGDFKLSRYLEEKNEYFVSHVHCDYDSFLITPAGLKIQHKGFKRHHGNQYLR